MQDHDVYNISPKHVLCHNSHPRVLYHEIRRPSLEYHLCSMSDKEDDIGTNLVPLVRRLLDAIFFGYESSIRSCNGCARVPTLD